MSEPLLSCRDGDVVTLTLHRPELRNPISDPDLIDAFEQAIAGINADSSVRALILTGSGSAFSSGGNVKHMRDRQGMFAGTPAEIRVSYQRGIQRIPRAMATLEVPSIAAVNGPAIGAGNDLACMCDLRIASTTARFAESFVKVGIIPGDGGCWLLPRVVGHAKAAEKLLLGDPFTGEQAVECGIANAVLPAGELLAHARRVAERFNQLPPGAVRDAKRLMRAPQCELVLQTIKTEGEIFGQRLRSPEAREAFQAFFKKRRPDFSQFS